MFNYSNLAKRNLTNHIAQQNTNHKEVWIQNILFELLYL